MILLASFAAGLGSALLPVLNVEAYLVGLAALHDGPLLWLAVLVTTAGHLAGKTLFWALGRGLLVRGLPRWLARRHALDDHLVASPDDLAPVAVGGPGLSVVPVSTTASGLLALAPVEPRTLRARVRCWSGVERVEALAGRPWATFGLCAVSAATGLPPFALTSVLLGRLRMPLPAFLLAGGLGRLLRFAVVAGLAGAVLGSPLS